MLMFNVQHSAFNIHAPDWLLNGAKPLKIQLVEVETFLGEAKWNVLQTLEELEQPFELKEVWRSPGFNRFNLKIGE